MKLRFSRAARWLSGLPTIFVVGLWFVLWQAWPTVPPNPVGRHPVDTLRITYLGAVARVSEFTLMQLPFVQSPAASGPLILEDNLTSLSLLRAVSTVHRLEREDLTGGTSVVDLPALLVEEAATNAVFRPFFVVPRVFAASPPREYGLVVEISDSLRERGFTVPGWTAAELEWTNSAWQVALRVECADDGVVEDVFVESGTTNRGLNLSLVRRIQSFGKSRPGARCRGMVTVRYGEE